MHCEAVRARQLAGIELGTVIAFYYYEQLRIPYIQHHSSSEPNASHTPIAAEVLMLSCMFHNGTRESKRRMH